MWFKFRSHSEKLLHSRKHTVEFTKNIRSLDLMDYGNAPDIILEKILGFLRPPDVIKCSIVSKHWRRNAISTLYRFDRIFGSTNRFTWDRIVSVNRESWIMTERMDSSLCFMPKCNAIFLFGGSTLDSSNSNARFNDLWKFDMKSLKWGRIVVRKSPFPVPKSQSTLVKWGEDRMVLFGGYRATPPSPIQSPNYSLSEVHIYSLTTKQWHPLDTINDGPRLSGHASIVCSNNLVVFGGMIAENQPNNDVWVLDLTAGRWFKPTFVFGVSPTCRVFATLISLEEGKLLLVSGSGLGNTTDSDSATWIVSWNPNNLDEPWSWKRKHTVGRRCGEAGEQNKAYTSVAYWEIGGKKRIASLGQSPFPRASSRVMRQKRQYDLIDDEIRLVMKHAKLKLEELFRNRFVELEQLASESEYDPESLSQETGVKVRIRGIEFSIENMWNLDAERNKFGRKIESRRELLCRVPPDPVRARPDSAAKRTLVRAIRIPLECSSLLRDSDVLEIAVQVRNLLSVLHAQHYLSPSQRDPVKSLRKAHLARFVLFTADITNIEEEEILLWEAQPSEFRASPLCKRFQLIATDDELIMHGGQRECDMTAGGTYLLTPVA